MTQESGTVPQTTETPKPPPTSSAKSADGSNQENKVSKSNGETKKNNEPKTAEKKAAPKKAASKPAAKKAAPKKTTPKKAAPKAPALPKGMKSGIQRVPLSRIVVREGANPRLEFDSKALQEMVESLRIQGQLHPIAVAPRADDDKLEVIYGERRFRAAKQLKWKDMWADVVVGKSREEHFVMRVQENIHRADLNAYEVARAIQGYITAKGCTAKDAAEAFGVKQAFLSQRLKILKMPAELQLALSRDEINFTQARELARLDPKEQVKTLNQMAKGGGGRAADITRTVEKKRAAKHTAKDGKKRGRPARTKENAPNIGRQNLDNAIEALNNFAIELKPKTETRDGLVTLYERFTNCRSDTKKEQLRGAIAFAEWQLGIRDDF
jgi:ParB family chromosome partitioning protein